MPNSGGKSMWSAYFTVASLNSLSTSLTKEKDLQDTNVFPKELFNLTIKSSKVSCLSYFMFRLCRAVKFL